METTASWVQIGGDYGNPVQDGGFFKNESNGDWMFWHGTEACDGFSESQPVYGGSRPDGLIDEPWINWESVNQCMGMTETPTDAYSQLEMAASYYGWDNFDSYPTPYTESELQAWIDANT